VGTAGQRLQQGHMAGLWLVQAGYQPVHDPKAPLRRNHQARPALVRLHLTCRAGHRLERTDNRGAHGYHPPTICLNGIDRAGSDRRCAVELLVGVNS
jgi:hypothetical protein